MMTLDNLLVLGMIGIAVAFILRRVWRRLHPSSNAAAGGGCSGCSGCGSAPQQRGCRDPSDDRHG